MKLILVFVAYSVENTESKKKTLQWVIKKFWKKNPENIDPKSKNIKPTIIGHVNDSDELYLENDALGEVIKTRYISFTEYKLEKKTEYKAHLYIKLTHTNGMELRTSMIKSLEKKPDKKGTPIREAEAMIKKV